MGVVIERLAIEPSVACSSRSDSGEDAKVKGTRKVFSRFIFVFARSQFSEPDYPGARNRLSLVRREKSRRKFSLSVFGLAPDLLFDCLRVYEYAKIRTVLHSSFRRSSLFLSRFTKRYRIGVWRHVLYRRFQNGGSK